MTITPKTLIHHCLIGLMVKIIRSSNPTHLNLIGKIVDETKHTLIIKTDGKEKRIPKKDSVFQFHLSKNQVVEVVGDLLISRPEERIKKRITYKWNN
ncbi:MAG: ribonuclease P protein component 1 [Candidatus Helarchaeota archaeon]|nr:ribonuclease P protein component 1 [Candidatus Helarchaeota archaeon]